MKIVCLLKIVPNIDNIKCDKEKNTVIRENVKLIINSDDACALEKILKIKDLNPSINIEVVSMGPESNSEILKDLIRRGVDKAVLISDKKFQGSDTYSTSKIIGKYLQSIDFDLIVGGTTSLDGDTGHVLPQIADLLDLDQFSHVTKLEIKEDDIEFEAQIDGDILKLSSNKKNKLILGFSKLSKEKLRFTKFKNLKKDVESQFEIISNSILGLDENILGLNGSPTRVVKAFIKEEEKKDTLYLTNTEKDIELFLEILQEKGVLKNV